MGLLPLGFLAKLALLSTLDLTDFVGVSCLMVEVTPVSRSIPDWSFIHRGIPGVAGALFWATFIPTRICMFLWAEWFWSYDMTLLYSFPLFSGEFSLSLWSLEFLMGFRLLWIAFIPT